MRVSFMIVLSCGLILGLAGCGGGGSSTNNNMLNTPTPTPTPSALNVSPSSATVALNGHKTFSATSNGVSATVAWSVNNVQGGNSTVGTIDTSGNYIGPASFPSPNNVTVTATLQSNTSLTGTAAVTIVYPNNNATSQAAPVQLGTSGGNVNDSVISGNTITCCSGTLGSLVSKGGNLFILSNNHVLDKSSFGNTNDPISQPGLVDNNCKPGTTVAMLSQAAALKPNPCSGVCSGPAPSNVDAAIAQILPGMVDTSGAILDLGAASSTSIAAAPPSKTLAVPATVLAGNEGVAKSGRSSGLTCSNLSSVNTTVTVDYDSSCGGPKAFTATFSNQVIINGGNFSAAGDSGSLVVTSDTARPVGLLYAGNSNSTTANPIADVISALGLDAAPFGSGGDHQVSCQPTATVSSASTTAGTSGATLTMEERNRVMAVQQKYGNQLLQNRAIRDVTIGASVDNPHEGALLVTVNQPTAVPAQLDGVRTRVIYTDMAVPRAGIAAINAAAKTKDAHAAALMSEAGIQGVGVGVSDDNPAEAALVIYVITGMGHPEIPAVVDGLRTKIIEGDRFRAFGWGHEIQPSACSKKVQVKITSNKTVKKLSALK